MDTSYIIFVFAQILGLISWVLLLYSYTREDIDNLLYIQILVCIFDVASYLLLGAWSGFLICFVELVKTILYYKTDKDRLIFKVSLIFYFLIGLLTIKAWYACLPVLGSIIDSFGVSRDSKTANICSIISNTLWTIYDILILSYIGAFNDIVVVICNIIVLFVGYKRLTAISKFRILKYRYLSKKMVDEIYKIDLNNFHKTWDKHYQLSIYRKNKDSLYIIEYKDKFIGYINYLSIDLHEYEKLKRIKTIPDKIDVNEVIPFKINKKNYILIESINIKHDYEKEKMVDLISNKIKSLIKNKHKRRIYIHGILGFALTNFEKDVYQKLNFKVVKKIDNFVIYELDEDLIKVVD